MIEKLQLPRFLANPDDQMSRSFFVDSLIVQKPPVTSHSVGSSVMAAVTSSSALLPRHHVVQPAAGAAMSPCQYRHPADLNGFCCPICIHPPSPTALPLPPPPPPLPPPPHHHHHHHHHLPHSPVSMSLPPAVSAAHKSPPSAHSALFVPTGSKSLITGLPGLSGQFQQLMASQFSSRHPHVPSPPDSLRRGGGGVGGRGSGDLRSQSLSPSSTPPTKRGRCSDAGGE